MDNMNMRDTIAPKSNQLNADDLLNISRTITITGVKRGDTLEQPVSIHFEGDNGKPWYPCKSMRRVMVSCWGDNGADWVGKQATLFCEPSVKFGGVAVGGIRISHLSHIERDMVLSLTVTKAKRAPYKVAKLVEAQSTPPPAPAPTEKTAYPDAKFDTELPRMRESIRSGKASAATIIAYCEQSHTLTKDQRDQIEAPIEAATTTEEQQ